MRKGKLMRSLAFLAAFIPAVVHADGFYIAGGGFVSSLDVRFMGLDVEVSDTRPMLFAGYGVTGRAAGERLRLFAGLEGLYMGSGKRKSGDAEIFQEVEVVESDSMSTPTPAPQPAQEPELEETREYSIKQGETWGVGLRFGLAEGRGAGMGVLYILGGYAQTELEGEGEVHDAGGDVSMTVPNQSVDFGGYYYGVGYEYLFTEHFGMRIDWLGFDYSGEEFINEAEESVRSKLKQSGVFIGLSGKF